jgi:hypothetical protein
MMNVNKTQMAKQRIQVRQALLGVSFLAATVVLGACNGSSTPKAVGSEAGANSTAASNTPVQTSANPIAEPNRVETSAAADTSAKATPSPAATQTSAPIASSNTAAPTAAVPDAAVPDAAVLPVVSNPITNTATEKLLVIDSVLVENNVDANGKTASDHLEIALSNKGSTDLRGVEIFYTFANPATSVSESYYAKLPVDFVVPAGGKRVAHFDNSGAPDHFPVNKFSLYYTDTAAMDVSVVASATGAAVQTMVIKKDAGGPEQVD